MSLLIGITGGSGCGTTTVGEILANKYGVLFVNADAVYHKLLAEDASLLKKLSDTFGSNIIREGVLDRRALATIVFNDEEKLKALETITHPAVIAEVDRIISSNAPAVAAVEAIALIECGLAKRCDAVIGVLAPFEKRLGRIISRDSISEDAASERIKAQKSESFYEEYCDYIVRNDGTLDDLEEAVCEVYRMIITKGR